MKNDLINPIRLDLFKSASLILQADQADQQQSNNRIQPQAIAINQPAGQSSSWTSRAFVVNHCFCVAGIHFGHSIGQSEIRKQLLKFPCLDLKFRSLILIFEFY
jgi:hypothetical protein